MAPTFVRHGMTLAGLAALAVTAAVASPVAPAYAAAGCEVEYTSTSWDTGFYADARIKNLGGTWLNSYTVTFTFTGDQQITNGWNHIFTQSGADVSAQGATWMPSVPNGDTVSLGFVGSHTGTNSPPTDWRVNGVACSLAGGSPAVIAEPTAVSVPEGGGTSLTIRLSHPPAQPVQLGMRSSGTGIWGSLPVILVFTPTNWSTPQSYPIFNMPDADDIDDVIVFTLSAPGYEPDTVTITQIDRD